MPIVFVGRGGTINYEDDGDNDGNDDDDDNDDTMRMMMMIMIMFNQKNFFCRIIKAPLDR